MAPTAATSGPVDGRLAYSKLGRYLCPRSLVFLETSHLRLCEFAAPVPFALSGTTSFDHVATILLRGANAEMNWINAHRVAAEVAYKFAPWDCLFPFHNNSSTVRPRAMGFWARPAIGLVMLFGTNPQMTSCSFVEGRCVLSISSRGHIESQVYGVFGVHEYRVKRAERSVNVS